MSETLAILVKNTLKSFRVTPQTPLLAGVSGGIDSMVMADLLHSLGFNVSVAHVNFQLRGVESDSDAKLVRDWCIARSIPIFEHAVDTAGYARLHGLNIQSAARQIRYDWWEELAVSNHFSFIATAHHRDDAIETLFLNLLRGTGIKGLTGIPAQRGIFIRPLIRASRKEIELYAQSHHIPYRDDRSNASDDYQRNRIRHHLVPLIRELVNDPENMMNQTLHRIRTEWEAWEESYLNWQKKNIKVSEDGFELTVEKSNHAFLLRWLEEKNIPWQLAYDYVHADHSTGHPLDYNSMRLSRTTDGFFLRTAMPLQSLSIPCPGTYQIGENEFTIEIVNANEYTHQHDPNIEFTNADVVSWPLEIRNYQPGDRFQPLGMGGKSKKLQDFLVDMKMALHEKENIKVLINNQHIIWVMGQRLDERAKVQRPGKDIYKLSWGKKPE